MRNSVLYSLFFVNNLDPEDEKHGRAHIHTTMVYEKKEQCG